MEHFSEEVFADYVRGIKHAELDSHLSGDCQQCSQVIQVWSRLQAITARESNYAPPSESVRMVKLEFAAAAQEEAQPATLVFDSFAQFAFAGVRSTGPVAARQLVYEVEGMMVDLRFDHSPGSKCISLIGQVLKQEGPGRSLANAPVMLWTEKGLVMAETRTNGFGEFQLEFEVQSRMRLSIQAFGGNVIRIPLADLVTDQEGHAVTNGIRSSYH